MKNMCLLFLTVAGLSGMVSGGEMSWLDDGEIRYHSINIPDYWGNISSLNFTRHSWRIGKKEKRGTL